MVSTPYPYPPHQSDFEDWTAPEILAKAEFDETADVYSFGVILSELITRKLPYQGIPDSVISHRVITGTLRPAIPQDAPMALRSPAMQCLEGDHRKRPSFRDLAEKLQVAQRQLVEEERTSTRIIDVERMLSRSKVGLDFR